MITQSKVDKQGVLFNTENVCDRYRAESLEKELSYIKQISNYLSIFDTLYDIGACIGAVGLHFARKCKKIVFVEPDPSILKRLKMNIEINHFKNTEVCEAAFSDTAGITTLYTTEVNNLSPTTAVRAGTTQIKVNTITMDMLIERYGNPDVIKCDIEGDEIHLVGQLEKIHPVLFLELHPIMILERNRNVSELISYLTRKDYNKVFESKRSKQVLTIWK